MLGRSSVTESNTAELQSLFDEKSLFAIYRSAPSFRSNNFNVWVAGITFSILSLTSVLHITVPHLRDSFLFPFSDTFTLWANGGLALAGTILGFLIAGFAILCTILRPQTMVALLRLKSEKYQLTELKLLFVGFVDVMVQYLALLLWSAIVLIAGGKTGMIAMYGSILAKIHWMIPYVLLHVVFVLWGTWLVMLILTLKSFIFNLYQSLLLGLADAVDDYERQKMMEAHAAMDRSRGNIEQL
jgi:hypothetical protein